jgi:hypothetical protein
VAPICDEIEGMSNPAFVTAIRVTDEDADKVADNLRDGPLEIASPLAEVMLSVGVEGPVQIGQLRIPNGDDSNVQTFMVLVDDGSGTDTPINGGQVPYCVICIV